MKLQCALREVCCRQLNWWIACAVMEGPSVILERFLGAFGMHPKQQIGQHLPRACGREASPNMPNPLSVEVRSFFRSQTISMCGSFSSLI